MRKENDMTVVEKIVSHLTEKQLRITTVESCTGGFLINALTNVEGASNITSGAYITYSNEQKIKVGVSKEVIEKYGVYSKECAEAMAYAGFEATDANISIGITGTFSNLDPNNEDSVQGVVFYAILNNGKPLVGGRISVVPMWERPVQKEFVSNMVFEKLLNYLSEIK